MLNPAQVIVPPSPPTTRTAVGVVDRCETCHQRPADYLGYCCIECVHSNGTEHLESCDSTWFLADL